MYFVCLCVVICQSNVCVKAVIGSSHLWHGMVFVVVILYSVGHTKIHLTHEKQCFSEVSLP